MCAQKVYPYDNVNVDTNGYIGGGDAVDKRSRLLATPSPASRPPFPLPMPPLSFLSSATASILTGDDRSITLATQRMRTLRDSDGKRVAKRGAVRPRLNVEHVGGTWAARTFYLTLQIRGEFVLHLQILVVLAIQPLNRFVCVGLDAERCSSLLDRAEIVEGKLCDRLGRVDDCSDLRRWIAWTDRHLRKVAFVCPAA